MPDIKRIFRLEKEELLGWSTLMTVLCICFLPLCFNFIWGNHDWQPVIFRNGLNNGLIEGRFSQYVFINLLMMGEILPVLNILLGFAAYSLALSLLTTRFFKFRINSLQNMLFLTAAATLPYMIEILYFQFISMTQLMWTLVITEALISADRASRTHYWQNTILCTILLLFAIGGYPASVNLFITAACLKTLQTYTTPQSIKKTIKNTIPYILSATVSLIILALAHTWLKKNGLMLDIYNARTVTIKDALIKVPTVLGQSLQSFIRPQPYFETSFKLITAVPALLFAIIYLCKGKTVPDVFCRVFLLCALLLGLKFSGWLTDETGNYFTAYDPAAFMVRADFYAFPCFLIFIFFEIKKLPILAVKNILTVTAALLIWLNIKTDLTYAKISILGFEAENKLLDRLTERIQLHPHFNQKNGHSLLQAGEISLRPKFYTDKQTSGYYTLEIPYTRHWIPFESYNFYAPFPYVLNRHGITDIPPALTEWLRNLTAAWPDKDAVYIDERYIVIPLTSDGKQMLLEQFNALSGENK